MPYRQANEPATQEDPIDGVIPPTPEQAECLQDLEALQEKKRNPHKQYVERLRANLPQAMLTEKRFVRYYLGAKDTAHGSGKIPRGSVSDPSSWASFDDCVAALIPKDEGVGFVFTGSEFHGLDLDHVRNAQTGEICPEAKVLLTRFNSWAEVSISGTGLHILFTSPEEITRYKKLGADHVQYWHPRHSPRFFALTGDLVPGYNSLNDGRKAFLMVGGTLAHTNARLREELQDLDPEQCAKLPPLQYVQELTERKEKSKTKTRKVVAGFTIKDYLAFNRLQVINECDNELGHCVRVASCPIKGAAHATHNDTTCNFIFPAKDGGLAFHCQSSGCSEKSIHDVIKVLAEVNGVYPHGIYEEKQEQHTPYKVTITSHKASTIKSEVFDWIIKGYLPKGAEVHFFAPKGRGKTKICNHWNKLANDQGIRVVRFNMEDHEGAILKPSLYAAGCNLELTEVVDRSALVSKDGVEMQSSIDLSQPEYISALEEFITGFGDVGLVILEPINNYKGRAKAISEDDMRPIHTALAVLAEKVNICIVTVSHPNRKKDVDILEKAHGASSGVNVARVNLYLDKDSDEESEDRVLADAGSNIKVGKSLAFKIVEQPPFVLDGVTHSEIAIAVFVGESDKTAQELSGQGESPSRLSQAKDIKGWLDKYLRDKEPILRSTVLNAAKQYNKDWSEENITKVFNRNKKSFLSDGTRGGNNKDAKWTIVKGQMEAFDLNKGVTA